MLNLRSLTFFAAFRLLAGLFLLMFLLRFAYSFTRPAGQTSNGGFSSPSYFEGQSDLRKNYASEKQKSSSEAGGMPSAATQKYEKTATLNARTDEFEQDEARLRSMTQSFTAIIQYEQRTGNPGHRALHLMIGVPPALFDSFYMAAQRVAFLQLNTVTKVDKTTEFRELNAKRASLEKALANLTDLKNRAGSITDLISLHDKILDIETQMQALGVELGNFSAENEFCTIRYSLYESGAAKSISLLRRAFDAFVWTVKYYLLVLVALGGMAVVALLMVTLGGRISAAPAAGKEPLEK